MYVCTYIRCWQGGRRLLERTPTIGRCSVSTTIADEIEFANSVSERLVFFLVSPTARPPVRPDRFRDYRSTTSRLSKFSHRLPGLMRSHLVTKRLKILNYGGSYRSSQRRCYFTFYCLSRCYEFSAYSATDVSMPRRAAPRRVDRFVPPPCHSAWGVCLGPHSIFRLGSAEAEGSVRHSK